jgi:two-component system, NarL family, sensor histidine kinase UhpB
VWRRVSLLWLLFAGTAAVMVAAAAVLALSPAAIHSAITTDELIGLLAGLAAMLVADLLFLHRALAPLRRVTTLMGSVDLMRPGTRIGEVRWACREFGLVAEAFDAMLARLEAERLESSRRALAAREGERLRVARELHDELGQTLTATALRAENALTDTGARSEALGEIVEALQQSLSEVRRIARELRPEALDDLGLVNALIALCTRISSGGGPRIDRAFAPDLPALGPEADLVIYRVAQEALTNALRHANPRRVTIALAARDNDVVLTVRDDGDGLPHPLEEGVGIAGMHERALLIGALLELRSAHARGVEVRLTVPTPGLAA